MTWRGWASLLLAVLVGGAAAVVIALALPRLDDPGPAPLGDRLQAAADELRVDRVHVPPDGRAMLDEEGEARLEEVLRTVEPALYLVVWENTREAGYDSVYDAADQLGAEVAPDGVVVVWQGPGDGSESVSGGYFPPSLSFEGDPETRITEYAATFEGERIESLDETTGDVVAGSVTGAFLALLAYGLLMVVVGGVRVARGLPFVVPGPFGSLGGSGGRSRNRSTDRSTGRSKSRGRP